MRETVEATSVVCSVENTRWPVSAAASAMRIVSGIAHFADDDHVRRLAERRAQRGGEVGRIDADLDLLDEAASGARARTRSGSSIVTMCRASRRLISSTSAASVVVLPDPVGPPISTSPRGRRVSASTPGGRPSAASGAAARAARGGRGGAAALAVQIDAKAARRRERSEASAMPLSRYCAAACGGERRAGRPPRFVAVERRLGERRDRPSTRTDGGAPATSSRSLPLRAGRAPRASGRGEPPRRARPNTRGAHGRPSLGPRTSAGRCRRARE